VIRDGLKVHFQEPPPKYLKSQRDICDDDVKLQVIKKLLKVRQRGYIAVGLVKMLMAFFGFQRARMTFAWSTTAPSAG
jgi:hypothetical protein